MSTWSFSLRKKYFEKVRLKIMFRRFLIFSLLSVFILFFYLQFNKSGPAVQAQNVSIYDSPLLADYKSYYDAINSGDFVAVSQIAFKDNGFLNYRAALKIAREPSVNITDRVAHYQRAWELRLKDPLDKLDRQEFLLEYARVADNGNFIAKAIELYSLALPDQEAEERLTALANPYALANSFLKAKQYQKAIDALNGLQAPSIEAPAYKRLKKDKLALDAYERWLAEVPTSYEALKGVAWSNYRLGYLDKSEMAFKQLGGVSGIYGLAFVAKKRGNLDLAISYLKQTGDAEDLWLASDWLESKQRYSDAIEIYKVLAQGKSVYADDSAYRIYVLANRSGDTATAQWAASYIPDNSFFGLKLNKSFSLPTSSSIATSLPEVVERSHLLIQIHDEEAARGELLYALQKTNQVTELLAIAEQLQILGEYRQSSKAAIKVLNRGYQDLKAYELAYPKAYDNYVVAEALRLGIDAELVWAIMRQESAFFPKALSRSNAQGLMQVIPSTWNWMAELQKENPANPFDISTNIRYGSFYLNWLSKYFKDYSADPELIISSYNRGQGYIKRLFEGNIVNKDKDELYREIDALETREYLQRVMANYEIYKLLY